MPSTSLWDVDARNLKSSAAGVCSSHFENFTSKPLRLFSIELASQPSYDTTLTEVKPKSFLVIEDNADDATLIRRAFESLESCRAFVCRNLSEAKAYLRGSGMYANRSIHPFPNAVICDLNLGGESGVEFVDWLMCSVDFKTMPVVILTGSTCEADLAAAKNRGAVSVLKKPARFEELRPMLKDLAGKLCS
jgi:CheY-like chemotaxis protein